MTLRRTDTRDAYSRAEEMTWSTFCPAVLIDVKSSFKSDGTVVAWEFREYSSWESTR